MISKLTCNNCALKCDEATKAIACKNNYPCWSSRCIEMDLENGKYTIRLDTDPDNFVFEALRFHEPWRNLAGDKLVYTMFQYIIELKIKLANKED